MRERTRRTEGEKYERSKLKIAEGRKEKEKRMGHRGVETKCIREVR